MSATNCCSGVRERSTGRKVSAPWRLAGLTLVSLLGVGLLTWHVSSTWARLRQLRNEFVTMEAESFYLGLHLRNGLEHMNSALLRFQLSRAEREERNSFHAEAQAMSSLLSRTKPLLGTQMERQLADQIGVAFKSYLRSAVPLLETSVRAVRRESASEVSEHIREISAPVLDLTERLIQAQKVSWKGFLDASYRTLDGLWQASLITMLLLAVFAMLMFVLAYRATVAPLRHQLTETRTVLERQEKLASLGTLAAGVAHEIRNPLASLKFRLFSLRESLPSDFASHEDVLVIGDEINRLERIIKDFLQFARPSEPAMAEVAADQMLQTVGELLRPALQSRGVCLVVEPSDRLWVCADRQQIEQVLINLVQNAADSTDGGGTVTLRGQHGAARFGGKNNQAVILEVADTGRGIQPDVQGRLFDPFFSTKAGGTGLGLPVSERIIEKHGGLLQFQTQLNRGTTFQVVLPCNPSHARQNPDH